MKKQFSCADEADIEQAIRTGDACFNSEGVTNNLHNAFSHYLWAAEKGSIKAQCRLGELFLNSQYIDYSKALMWYQKASAQDDPTAHHQIGWMYQNGYGVEKDYKQAVNWYRKASRLGVGTSFHNIGYLYENGLGTTKDAGKALEWYRKGAELADSDSIAALRRLEPESLQSNMRVSSSSETASQQSISSPTNQATSNGGLWTDMKKYSGEVYQTGDASAGFKLLQEVLGIVSVLLLAAQLELLITGGRTSVALNSVMSNLVRHYARLNSDQRRQVRAWVSVARTGFGLFSK